MKNLRVYQDHNSKTANSEGHTASCVGWFNVVIVKLTVTKLVITFNEFSYNFLSQMIIHYAYPRGYKEPLLLKTLSILNNKILSVWLNNRFAFSHHCSTQTEYELCNNYLLIIKSFQSGKITSVRIYKWRYETIFFEALMSRIVIWI